MNTTLPRLAAATTLMLLLSAVCAQAQESPIRWSLELERVTKSFKRGETLNLRVKAKISKGWHLYGLKQRPSGPRSLSFSTPNDQLLEMAGPVIAPAAKINFDRNFSRRISYYEGEVTFILPVKISVRAPPGTRKIHVRVSYQSCNEEQCFPPKDVLLETFIAVRRGTT